MKKIIIIIVLHLLLINGCTSDIRYERAFDLEYYLITPYPISNSPKGLIYYFYVKDSSGRLKEKGFQKQLLQLAFCRFDSNDKIKTIIFTSKFFENFEELGYHTMDERKIIIGLGYKIENDLKIPYFATRHKGSRYRMTYEEAKGIVCPVIDMW